MKDTEVVVEVAQDLYKIVVICTLFLYLNKAVNYHETTSKIIHIL